MPAHPAGPRHSEPVAGQPGHLIGATAPSTTDMHALARVWPMTANRGSGGAMQIGGCDVRDLATTYGTPAVILDERDVRSRARLFAQAYRDAGAHRVYYAAKALLTTRLARWVVDEGLGIDVASAGELAVALRAGVSPDLLVMHGNNKSRAEIEAAVAARVGRIVIDSLDEIVRVSDLAHRAGIVQPVLVRATIGVEAHTHEFIATAHEDQKFGLSAASGAVDEAVRRIVRLPSLEFRGLHSHIGSQIFDAAGFEIAATRVVALARRLSDEQGVHCAELDLGGGMGIAYTVADDPLDVAVMATQVVSVVRAACSAAGLDVPQLSFEPGRAIVGPGGVTLYEVGTVKPVELDNGVVRGYVSVDGGMSDNIRTALYEAVYTVTLASRVSEAEPMLARVVGKHCESGDIVVRDCWLPSDITPGDLIAVAATGAYCRAMASNYNLIPRPPVIAVLDGTSSILLRRETLEDLLALDPG